MTPGVRAAGVVIQPMSLIAAGRRGVARKHAIVLLLGSVALGGCYDMDDADNVTGAVNHAQQSSLPAASDSELRAYAEEWGKRYEANPGEKVASINYGRALRALTRYGQAVAVIQSAAVKAPKDYEILGAYGKALADAGQLQQAADVLSRSYAPEDPNWSNMSAQGVVADRLGDHDAAQEYYRNALKIAPNEPTVLNNLGLSYMLAKKMPQAEETLRRAVAQPGADYRERDNLALVLSLEGKFAEGEKLSKADMSGEAAAANIAAIRRMISQPNSWSEIKKSDMNGSAKPTKADPGQDPKSSDPAG
jgi:Flp pilus assembly protein TadD